ncbi:hypothetical protein HME9302_02109 [Alteripontixanthobacter maritimus]|uniref:Uncharacterized protein n=1 Tax=Alteripontixanthobacter maritimus TaxID=2161824 RepID=A0A369Q7N9_9SPHN|nr:hypothetical protein HME9302_02109 [Alteripontixanthobacter maritimus]
MLNQSQSGETDAPMDHIIHENDSAARREAELIKLMQVLIRTDPTDFYKGYEIEASPFKFSILLFDGQIKSITCESEAVIYLCEAIIDSVKCGIEIAKGPPNFAVSESD